MYTMSIDRKKAVFADWMEANSALELAEANVSSLQVAMECAQSAYRNDPSLSDGVDTLYRELSSARSILRSASKTELAARVKLPKRFRFAG